MKTEEINIADILRNEPAGTMLYSPICGYVELVGVLDDNCINCKSATDKNLDLLFNEDGSPFLGREIERIGECLLFPSKENREWKTCEKLKNPAYKFDSFDKVLVRDDEDDIWQPSLFAFYTQKPLDDYPYVTIGGTAKDPTCFRQCISYNDKTKHLIGTTLSYEEQ